MRRIKRRYSRNLRIILITIVIITTITIFSLFCKNNSLKEKVSTQFCYLGITLSKLFNLNIESFDKDLKILEAMGSRNPYEMVKPSEYTIILEPGQGFLLDSTVPNIIILINTVATKEANERRNLLRQSWYRWAPEFRIRILFFLGLPRNSNLNEFIVLKAENEIYGDLIVDDFEEGYYKLAQKTLRMYKWFLQTYSENGNRLPKYLIKTDHDVFVNIPNLISHLNSINYDPIGYIGGHLLPSAPPDPDHCSKWFITPGFWLPDGQTAKFPAFITGLISVISGNLIERIYKASLTLDLLPFEDVFVTGLVANDFLNLTLSKIPFVKTVHDYEVHNYLSNITFVKETIAFHPMEPARKIIEMYQTVIN